MTGRREDGPCPKRLLPIGAPDIGYVLDAVRHRARDYANTASRLSDEGMDELAAAAGDEYRRYRQLARELKDNYAEADFA